MRTRQLIGEPPMSFCRMCGTELTEGSKYCSQCGAAVLEASKAESEVEQAPVAHAVSTPSESTPAPSSEKKPFYKRGWFIALAAIASLAIIVCIVVIGSRSLMISRLENQPITETLAAYGEFESTTVYGSGEDFVDIPCVGSPCIVDFEYEGVYHDYGYGYSYTGGVCNIWTIDKEGNKLAFVDHGLGPVSRTFTDWTTYDRATALYVDAEGNWSVTFRPMTTMEYAENGSSFNGSNVVAIDADAIHEISFTHGGSSNFYVIGVGVSSAKELVDTVGLFRGTIQWDQPKAFFAVVADGDWTIEWA